MKVVKLAHLLAAMQNEQSIMKYSTKHRNYNMVSNLIDLIDSNLMTFLNGIVLCHEDMVWVVVCVTSVVSTY